MTTRILNEALNTARTYLDPTYHAKTTPSGLSYHLCSLTHLTEKTTAIQNRALRYIAKFFTLVLDAVAGFGLIGTIAYNSAAFLFNNTYARIKNSAIASKDKEASKKWNTTAFKTLGVIASIGLLYRFGAFSALKGLFTKNPPNPTPTAPLTNPSISQE